MPHSPEHIREVFCLAINAERVLAMGNLIATAAMGVGIVPVLLVVVPAHKIAHGVEALEEHGRQPMALTMMGTLLPKQTIALAHVRGGRFHVALAEGRVNKPVAIVEAVEL